jgi:hypothetical protein
MDIGVIEGGDMDVDGVVFYDGEGKQDGSGIGKGKDEDGMRPLGTDCNALSEEIYQLEYAKSRRKSFDVGAESPPNSPLKSCSFGFEDVDMGCNVWAKEKEKSVVEENNAEDVKMEEALRATNVFLRDYEKGEDAEKFGDGEDNVL